MDSAEPNLDELEPELDLELERRVEARRSRVGCRIAAMRAIAFARRYRAEEGPGGRRERECVIQALAWRRAGREGLDGGRLGPGLASARVRDERDGRRTG